MKKKQGITRKILKKNAMTKFDRLVNSKVSFEKNTIKAEMQRKEDYA